MRVHSSVLGAAAAGDDAALEVLVRTYHDRVYRYGVRVCHDRFDADDAVQEAFIALSARRDVAQGPSTLGWLLRVVRNACLRLLRPWRRERRALGERIGELDSVATKAAPALSSTGLEAEGDPERSLQRWELVRAVHAAISTLDRPHREVLVLRDLEGLSAEETCRALGLDLGAMKSRLHRARLQLRTKLGSPSTPTAHDVH
jgi:RNA polymerase sigma-70 factor, ECF subfamily